MAMDSERNKPYQITCFGCGANGELVMLAHRDKAERVVGWIFACSKCEEQLRNTELVRKGGE